MLLAKHQRGITRFRITESIHAAATPRTKLADGLVWVPRAEIDTITLSGPHRRWIAEILSRD
jgi:A/G-specific adenine glycosylase